MKELPVSERPYEKFINQGEKALSDAELLAIIIKSGCKNTSALDLAREILTPREGNLLNLYALSFHEMTQIPGIGRVKAIQLKAIAELSKRISMTQKKPGIKFLSTRGVAEYYMEQMRHLENEIFICVCFDAKGNYLGDEILSMGGALGTSISTREILLCALQHKSIQIAVLHNHPSGNPSPSQEDCSFTLKLKNSLALIDMYLYDHIIIGDGDYYSFLEQNFSYQ